MCSAAKLIKLFTETTAAVRRLCNRCESIRTLSSSLCPSPVQFVLHSSLRTLPSSSRCLSLASNIKPKKLAKGDRSNSREEEYARTELVEDSRTMLGQRTFVRKDNLKWQKSPWKLKQLRFAHHIMNLVRKGKVDEAHEVLQQMKKGRVHPEVAVYNSLIAGYGRKGDIRTSFRLFNELKKCALLPTDHTYSSLFAACAEVGPKAATILDKIQDEIERRNVLLNSISTNALITALSSCGRHDDALDVYSDMTNKNLYPDLHTFGSLLLAAAGDKEGGFEVARRVWSEMIASGVRPDLHCFNMLLQCVRDSGMKQSVGEEGEGGGVDERRSITLNLKINFGDAVKCLELEDKPVKVELCVTGTASFTFDHGRKINICLGHVGERRKRITPLRWLEEKDTELFFSLLKELKVRPDIRTYHLLAHLTLDPSHLMREMVKRKVPPDSRFMVAAIKMQALLGNLTGAKVLLDYSNKAGLELDQAGYQAVATSCHDEKDGIKLLDEMKACHVVPNEYVFGTLIGNAARSRSYEYLTTLLKKMLHSEVVPNDTIVEILEAAATHKPNSARQAKRLNGFKGYYKIWKDLMVPEDQELYDHTNTDQSEYY